MQHIISKVLLILSIIIAIVSTATPDWQASTGTFGSNNTGTLTQGLFKTCMTYKADVLGTKNTGSGSSSFPHIVSDASKARKSCQGLAISSIVFLSLSLACKFVPEDKFKYCHLIGISALILGVILMIACVTLYSDKVYQGSNQTSGVVNTKQGYGYSIYLAIASVLLGVGAGATEMFGK